MSHDAALLGAFVGTVILFWAVMLVPIIIAFWRRHPSRWLILIVTIAFGATVVGWLIALVWSLHGFHRGADRNSRGGASGLNLFADDVKIVRVVNERGGEENVLRAFDTLPLETAGSTSNRHRLTLSEAASLLERLQALKSDQYLSYREMNALKVEILACTYGYIIDSN